MPDSNSHDRLMEILGEAIELAPADRAAFLDRACANDSDLRAQVERLLAHESPADKLLSAAPIIPLPRAPMQIGPYRIVKTLGEGGMGIVYLAEQTEPVRRQVALKLISTARISDAIIARFETERQALAMMNHPNVAQVFDAGATSDGRPYFAMEFVPGEAITRYADQQNLDISARLELFAVVCDAVQHAHQKGIIHRDIKPSNVIVTLQDGRPVPKVIDFGIAKAIEPDSRELLTLQGQLVGTPEYMSPEQASINALDVDTRSDVYSLGVLLYELLSGSLPFESTELRRAGAEEMRRIIRESDPPRLTTRLASNAGDVAIVAKQRRANPTSLARALRGDLEWITMKALEKDRSRRYDSAAHLAADVRRHLENEPVSAGPPSQLYRIRKFVRRHRISVSAAAIVLLAIALGAVGTTWQSIRATQQRNRAQRMLADIRALAGSFMFDVDEALQNGGPTKARQLLISTSLDYLNKVSAESTNDPALLHDLVRGYQRIGYVQFYPGLASLGRPKDALDSFTKARQLAEQRIRLLPGDGDANTELLAISINCADAMRGLDDNERAIASFDESIKLADELSRKHPEIVELQISKAVALDHKADALRDLHRNEESLVQMRLALDVRNALLKDHAEDVRVTRGIAISHEGIGSTLADMGRPEEGLAEFAMAEKFDRELLEKHPDSPIYRRDLALILNKISDAHATLRHVPEARAAITQAVREWENIVEEDPHNVRAKMDLAEGVKRLGDSLMISHDYPAAVTQFDRCRVMRIAISNDNPASTRALTDLATTMISLAEAQRQIDRANDALASIAQAVAVFAKVSPAEMGPVSVRNLTLAHLLAGQIHSKRGDQKSASDSFARAIGTIEKQLDEERPHPFALRVGIDAILGAAESCIAIGEIEIANAHVSHAKRTIKKVGVLDEPTKARLASLVAQLEPPTTNPTR